MKLMEEWWIKTFEIITEENLEKKELENLLNDSLIVFRP
jgi:hypothetical protein